MEKAHGPQRKPDPIPPAPLNEVFRLRFEGLLEEQLTVNTFCWRHDIRSPGTCNRGHVDALFQELLAPQGLKDLMCAATSADWVAQRMVIDLPTQPQFAPVPYGLNAIGGIGPVGHCPTTVSVVCHKISAFKGRHGRGRIGVPAVPLTWVLGTKLEAANLPVYQALANIFANVLNDGTNIWHPGVLGLDKRTYPTEPSKWADTWVDTVQGEVNPILGNIRRRRPGRGK